MHTVPSDYSTQQARQERARIVATAQGLFLERGIAAVNLAEVAFTLRIPVEAVERHFADGKPTLVKLVLESHLHYIHQSLQEQRETCRNAVEELLAMRRFMHQQLSASRSLFLRELESHYPTLWQYNRRVRLVFMLKYLRGNLRQGVHEGLYHPDLAVEERARQWFQQTDEHLRTAATAPELAETYYAHLSELLASITTPVGAYVVRRLQEAPPYY